MLFVLGNGELFDRLLENAVVDVLLLIEPLFSKMPFMFVLAREWFEVIDRLLADVVVPVRTDEQDEREDREENGSETDYWW